jgi:hypothetical protein
LLAVPALAGLVFALDLGWALSGIYTGSIFYGLVDEPAHLATGAIALSLVALSGRTLTPWCQGPPPSGSSRGRARLRVEFHAVTPQLAT